MKKARKNKFREKWFSKSKSASSESALDEVLAVLVDDKNGREYYVSVVDSFQLRGQEYVVMYNFEPDMGAHHNPEIVIMRAYRSRDGQHKFAGIRDKKELDEVFEIFFDRYINAEED